MEMRVKPGSKDVIQEMQELVNNRIDVWSTKKKEITNKNNPVNKNSVNKKVMDIMPWTIWWFEAGENVGIETGAHVNSDDSFFFNRPCIVVSKLKSQHDSDYSLVTILPMSTKSEGIGVHKKYIHKLEATKYPKEGKYKGLKKDSYILGHQIKTIDTKRLMTMVTKRIQDEDIEVIRNIIKKYIDIE